MLKIGIDILTTLFEDQGNAYVTSTHAAVVLDDELYVIADNFEGMDENDFNKYIQTRFK